MIDDEGGRHQLASCQGKVAHGTKAGALRQLRHMGKRNPVGVYRCRHCRQWHVGRVLGRRDDAVR